MAVWCRVYTQQLAGIMTRFYDAVYRPSLALRYYVVITCETKVIQNHDLAISESGCRIHVPWYLPKVNGLCHR